MSQSPECDYAERFDCRRNRWANSDYCIWHADYDGKPVGAIRNALSEERSTNRTSSFRGLRGYQAKKRINLQGAKLRDIIFLNGIDFKDCDLSGSDFSNSVLRGSSFKNSILRESRFHGTNLRGTKFNEANLADAEIVSSELRSCVLHNVNLSRCRFQDTELQELDFSTSTLNRTVFENSNLWNADFSANSLTRVKFDQSNLTDVDFVGSNLVEVEFSRPTFDRIDFTNADLAALDLSGFDFSTSTFQDSNLAESDLSYTNFKDSELKGANLEGATLSETELRNANLKDARLYQVLLTNVRISRGTDFGDTSVYESFNRAEMADPPPLERAAWTYRQLETLHERNAMISEASQFHIRKQDALRIYHWQTFRDSSWFENIDGLLRSIILTGNRYLTNYGESLKNILGFSVATVLISAGIYPLIGGVTDGSEVIKISDISQVGAFQTAQIYFDSLYFSTITFTTVGYGDFQPATWQVKAIAGLESLLGSLLLALFVFVLGRKATRGSS